MLNIDILKNDLEKLGIKKGDILLVRADLGQIGKVDTKEKQDYVNFILDTIGEEGTLVGLSFTNSFFIKKNKNLIFDGKNKSYTGAFANIMLNHSKALRSQHPTNSYVAIGKYAEYITKDHNEFSGAYEPIRKIIELNGKMLLIGCVSSSPGFTTTHLAEVDLGLHKRIILPSLDGVYYKKNNEIKIFKRKDVGSCSSTFYKFYSFYVKNELLFQGYVGNAYTVLADAKKIYRLDLEILKKNSKITICHNPRCMLCRARRWDNLIDMPIFIIRYLYTKFLKR
ncbi:AAC(3) family N-acetyltransferase [Aliarcobacter butzleri]|uniref:AAC(3) family N-acetyltransferase n=1 Tax=Aliarcobacter butzleri TaxID=28197 RepID=UPI00125F7CF8|nr:AAC(3) family N-acetyltransferase [Aliarcobacter butzleri]